MRRRTPGCLTEDELTDRKIARAEAEDPERVIRLLEPLVNDRRRARLLEVIDRRLASVAVIFDSPYDPHNGAAVIRSCEAFGVQSLTIIQRKVKFLAASSVTRGANKWIDLSTHLDSAGAIAAAERSGHELVATHPDGELTPDDLTAIPKLSLVLGNEREGIGDELLARCKRAVRVPMRGFVESLNVSVTAAILLHAATRGRAGDLKDEDRRRLYARGLYFSVAQAENVLRAAPSSA